MDARWETPARPGPDDTALGQPCFFRQYGVRDAQTGRDRPRRIERDVEAQDHPAVDVDRQGDPWPPDRQALLLVDDDDVEFGVIDLHEVQRPMCLVEHAVARRKPIEGGFPMQPSRKPFAQRQCADPSPNRAGMRDR